MHVRWGEIPFEDPSPCGPSLLKGEGLATSLVDISFFWTTTDSGKSESRKSHRMGSGWRQVKTVDVPQLELARSFSIPEALRSFFLD